MLSLDSVLHQLGLLGLSAHEDAVAAHLLDSGYEDTVPLKDLVKDLRKAVSVRSTLIAAIAAIAAMLPASGRATASGMPVSRRLQMRVPRVRSLCDAVIDFMMCCTN